MPAIYPYRHARERNDEILIYNPLSVHRGPNGKRIKMDERRCLRVGSQRFNFDERLFCMVRVRSTLYCLKINQKPNRLIHIVNLLPEDGKQIISIEKAKPRTSRSDTSIVNYRSK